jgi:uncharacterized surface protein with fasciclin (FAS1) repeats
MGHTGHFDAPQSRNPDHTARAGMSVGAIPPINGVLLMVRARPFSVVSAVVLTSAMLFAACGSDDAVTTEAPAESTPDTTAAVDTTVPETVPATDAPEVTEAPLGTIIDVATAAGTFNTFLAAIDAAGLTEQIATDGKYTFLAPTDETFAAAMDQAAIDAVLADPVAALALVNLHVLPGAQDVHAIGIFNNIVNIGGTSLTVTTDGDVVTVNGATITSPDIAADNGFIQVIDQVLVPAAG